MADFTHPRHKKAKGSVTAEELCQTVQGRPLFSLSPYSVLFAFIFAFFHEDN